MSDLPILPRHESGHATFGDYWDGWCGCAGCDPSDKCGCAICRDQAAYLAGLGEVGK